jgi:hypothetical protein
MKPPYAPLRQKGNAPSPRRYRDAETGEWRDAGSYRAGDLPALLYALSKAQEFMYSVPMPGEQEEQDAGEVPF